MPARSHLRRLWLIAAMLELLLPSLASVADARAEAESISGVAAHVEAVGSTGCPRVHPADCVVCRVVGTHAVAASPSALLDRVVWFAGTGVADPPCPLRSARAPGDPAQRAPPPRA